MQARDDVFITPFSSAVQYLSADEATRAVLLENILAFRESPPSRIEADPVFANTVLSMTGNMLDNGTLLTAINDPAASARVATNGLSLFDIWTHSEVDSVKQSSAEFHAINPTRENTFRLGFMSDIGDKV